MGDLTLPEGLSRQELIRILNIVIRETRCERADKRYVARIAETLVIRLGGVKALLRFASPVFEDLAEID